MSYPAFKISLFSQAASLAIHVGVVAVAVAGFGFSHAQFSTSPGQGGLAGQTASRVLQAEVQIAESRPVDNKLVTPTTVSEQPPTPVIDEEAKPAAPEAITEKNESPATTQVEPAAPAKTKPLRSSAGSTGGGRVKIAAAGNGGTKTTAQPAYDNQPPVYPQSAREKGQQGRVLLSIEVNQDGSVGNAEVKKSSGYSILDEAALSAAKKWRFVPATNFGEKVPDTIELPFVFSLH